MASSLKSVIERLQVTCDNELQQGLSTKVSKSGDTITSGSLTFKSDKDDISVNSIISTDVAYTAPTAARARAYRVSDSKGNILGDIRFRHETSGEINTSIIARHTAEDGTKTTATLYISPNRSGTVGSHLAMFNGNELLTKANGLPLSGGTMTGNIRWPNGACIYHLQTGDWNTLEVSGNGATLHLRGTNSPNYPNTFGITLDNGSTTRQFYGSIDGSLMWSGSNVLTDSSANATKIVNWGMPNYSAIISGIAQSYTAPQNGVVSFNKDVGGNTGNVTVNGATVYLGGNDASNEGNVMLFVRKGDVIDLSGSGAVGTSCFIPLYHGG